MNPSPFTMLKARNLLKKSIRDFFEQRGYLEVETPIMVPCPGTEIHLNYFETDWVDYSGKKHRTFLRSSPELHMKQLLSLGVGDIFQLSKCFRNAGECSDWHHPEFTMLEWYRVGIGFEDFMSESAALLRHTLVTFESNGFSPSVCIPTDIPKISVFEAFERFVGISLIDGDPDLVTKARNSGVISVRPSDDFETAYFKILLDRIEPELEKMGAVILFDFPPSQAALSRVESGRAKRFEIYVGRIELCNAFWELVDEKENCLRLRQSQALRSGLGMTVPPDDAGFLQAIANGIPESCGNALGFDRWLSILTGQPSLSTVIPFRNIAPFDCVL